MNWWLAAGSLTAVLALAAIAKLLGLGGAQRIAGPADAAALAESLVSGFTARAALVSKGGQIAVVAGEPGELVLIEPMGARFRARHFDKVSLASRAGDSAIALRLTPVQIFQITPADPHAAGAFLTALTGDIGTATLL